MGRDWRQLVLAVAIAFALAAAPVIVPGSEAQTVTKTSKKATKKQQPEPAADDGQQQTPQKKKKQDPAEAQKQIEAAQKLLEGGKADVAVQSLTAVLSAGNLPPGLMARALYYRGMGQRHLQKPALAISDLTSALWLKGGLSEVDRADALKQRMAAYSEAGLADSGSSVAGVPRNVRTASGGPDAESPAAQPSASSGWNLFGGLFGGNASPPPPQPAPQPPPAKTASISPGPSMGWTASTEVKPTPGTPAAAPPPAAGPVTPVAAPAPAPAAEGKFRVQLGLVRSGDEADAIAARVRSDLAAVFGSRGASVDQAVVGNMGTMYRVRVGPYASAGEGQAVCAKLKGSGLDCLVVTQ